MKATCEKVKEVLSESGMKGLTRFPALNNHACGCADCLLLIEQITELDTALDRMSLEDVSDSCMDTLLMKVKATPSPEVKELGVAEYLVSGWLAIAKLIHQATMSLVEQRNMRYAMVSATVILLALVTTFKSRAPSVFEAKTRPTSAPELADELRAPLLAAKPQSQSAALGLGSTAAGPTEPLREGHLQGQRADTYSADQNQRDAASGSFASGGMITPKQPIGRQKPKADLGSITTPPAAPQNELLEQDKPVVNGQYFKQERAAENAPVDLKHADSDQFSDFEKGAAVPNSERRLGEKIISNLDTKEVHADKALAPKVENRRIAGHEAREEITAKTSKERMRANQNAESSSFANKKDEVKKKITLLGGVNASTDGVSYPTPFELLKTKNDSALQQFNHERARIIGLPFKEARGYWQNNYIPGDPIVRSLQARLSQWDKSRLNQATQQSLSLDELVSTNAQPFDRPKEGAMAVYVSSDTRGVSSPSRALVQVGLKGAERNTTLRPPLHIGVVIDLRGVKGAECEQNILTLLDGISQEKRFGDSFELFLAGRGQVMQLSNTDFSHGHIAIALRKALQKAQDGSLAGIGTALRDAQAAALREANAGSLLGSNSVLFVTAEHFNESTAALSTIAHESALAGAPVSVIAVGNNVDPQQVDDLVRAGQGNRRVVLSTGDAKAVAPRELSSLSRAVARAVRVNIRLAPGVKLVDVLGSRRLDEPESQAVREAEVAVDRQVAASQAIASDRGSDDDGIQIVLPAFYADDSHVILLDLVIPAGLNRPAVEVTLKYKDLIALKNGTAQAALTFANAKLPENEMSEQVLKNYLAYRTSEAFNNAGEALSEHNERIAITTLTRQRDLLTQIGKTHPAFESDPQLLRDRKALSEYLSVLTRGALSQEPDQRSFFIDSLKYSAFARLVPIFAQG